MVKVLVMILEPELMATMKLVAMVRLEDAVIEGAGGVVAILGCNHIHH